MNNIKKNSNDKKLSDSEKKTNSNKNFNQHLTSQNSLNNKKIVLDSIVNITVELGTSKIKIKHFLNFSKGSILMLDKLSEEPLNIFMNGYLIGSGEIVVSENKYGIRIINLKKPLKSIDIPV